MSRLSNSARLIAAGVVLLSASSLSATAGAQTDEIQVYTAGIASVGTFNLTWHNNYVANGLAAQPFAGSVSANRSFNGVTEWAYGVAPWFEAGLYMPLYSRDDHLGWGFNGFKLRTLFVVPNADERTFVYGVNFEFSDNAPRWDDRRYTQETRPIVGWHLKPVDIIINPILDTKYEGGFKGLDFVPAARLAYNANPLWAFAAEEYDDFGTLGDLQPATNQVHQLFAVVDHTMGTLDVEAGVGFGLNRASDKTTFKLILSRDLNSPKK
ncbi:MAG TPA: hypothetical protein VN651_02175 [Gemmatimonadaceae bacterium]|nr:hypothetical protein [Gemmatimonadaceae bacterium]